MTQTNKYRRNPCNTYAWATTSTKPNIGKRACRKKAADFLECLARGGDAGYRIKKVIEYERTRSYMGGTEHHYQYEVIAEIFGGDSPAEDYLIIFQENSNNFATCDYLDQVDRSEYLDHHEPVELDL